MITYLCKNVCITNNPVSFSFFLFYCTRNAFIHWLSLLFPGLISLLWHSSDPGGEGKLRSLKVIKRIADRTPIDIEIEELFLEISLEILYREWLETPFRLVRLRMVWVMVYACLIGMNIIMCFLYCIFWKRSTVF